MNYSWFNEWKSGVEELNKVSSEVDEGRDKAYSLMSDKIKKIFARNGTVVDSIHFSTDSSVITVKLTGNTANAIPFKKSFLIDIGMPFTVRRKLNHDAENELYIDLYPFEED